MNLQDRTKALELTAEICKRFEGFSPSPYKCPAGVWTIGHGITRYPDGRKVTENDPHITVDQSTGYMIDLLRGFQESVLQSCSSISDTGLLAACTDLAYNIGCNAFASSTVRRRINAGELDKVPDAFRMWNKAGGKVLPGLVKRREAEIALFAK